MVAYTDHTIRQHQESYNTDHTAVQVQNGAEVLLLYYHEYKSLTFVRLIELAAQKMAELLQYDFKT